MFKSLLVFFSFFVAQSVFSEEDNAFLNDYIEINESLNLKNDIEYIKEKIESILPDGHEVIVNYSTFIDEHGNEEEGSVFLNIIAGSEEEIDRYIEKELSE